MFKRILVPVDGSPTSNKALVTALNLARETGAALCLFHMVEVIPYISLYEYSPEMPALAREGAERVLADALAIARASGARAETLLADDPALRLGEAVAGHAKRWNADLVVLGSHGRRGFDRLIMGSGAEQILRLSPVPVLTVRGEAAAVPPTPTSK